MNSCIAAPKPCICQTKQSSFSPHMAMSHDIILNSNYSVRKVQSKAVSAIKILFFLCQIKFRHSRFPLSEILLYPLWGLKARHLLNPLLLLWSYSVAKSSVRGFTGQCVNVSDGFSLTGGRMALNHHGMSLVLFQSKTAATHKYNMSKSSGTDTACGTC